jgi:hypothetical protein
VTTLYNASDSSNAAIEIYAGQETYKHQPHGDYTFFIPENSYTTITDAGILTSLDIRSKISGDSNFTETDGRFFVGIEVNGSPQVYYSISKDDLTKPSYYTITPFSDFNGSTSYNDVLVGDELVTFVNNGYYLEIINCTVTLFHSLG